MPYLLDADWAISALDGRPQVLSVISSLEPEGIAISWITVGEIYEGAFGSPTPEADLESFREFLRPFQVLDLNDPIMERFAEIRYRLRRRGQMIPDLDVLLGATALHYDLTVLTSNVRHLARIPSLKLYHPG